MKKAKFFKFKCLLVALIMVALCATTAFAAPYEPVENVTGHIDHPGSENCIYSCIFDELEVSPVPSKYAEVVDVGIHANCIYSCEHTDNPLVPTTEEIPLMSEEEFQKIIAEMMGISVEDFSEQQSEAYCNFHVFYSECKGNHIGSGCVVTCMRTATCEICKDVAAITVTETAHSWSTGWCGQTCTKCGTVEIFHAPGGCWYCK